VILPFPFSVLHKMFFLIFTKLVENQLPELWCQKNKIYCFL
jgi:hypothetical protein